MSTNVDLYNDGMQMLSRHQRASRSLSVYLVALAALLVDRQSEPSFTADAFVGVLEMAFTSEAGSLDRIDRHHCWEPSELEHVLGLLVRQVDDLVEMQANGSLDQEWIYFGIDAPSGQRWLNFDPLTYVECGLEGAFGGWRPGADSPRKCMPGDVAVLGDDGTITSVPAADVPSVTIDLPILTWSQIGAFAMAGQCYE